MSVKEIIADIFYKKEQELLAKTGMGKTQIKYIKNLDSLKEVYKTFSKFTAGKWKLSVMLEKDLIQMGTKGFQEYLHYNKILNTNEKIIELSGSQGVYSCHPEKGIETIFFSK